MIRETKKTLLILFLMGNSIPSKADPLTHRTNPSQKVEFFDSMEWDSRKNRKYRAHSFKKGGFEEQLMFSLKDLYDKNNFFERPKEYTAKIPKKIHQIWVGPKVPPALLKQSQESLKQHHPDWEYKLWTDADISAFNLENKTFYDLSTNYGEKADLLRYEILKRHGGVYVDVDFICFKPFDVLCQYDLWASVEPIDCSHGTGINNAVIGSVPDHPILNSCIATVKDKWYKTSIIFLRVGPRHFRECFLNYAALEKEANIIALPKSFFYPLDYKKGITVLRKQKRAQSLEQGIIDEELQALIKPETFAMHLWAGSWRNTSNKKNPAPELHP